jgi:hypothetical protein
VNGSGPVGTRWGRGTRCMVALAPWCRVGLARVQDQFQARLVWARPDMVRHALFEWAGPGKLVFQYSNSFSINKVVLI